jgi:protein gp37
VTITPHAHRIAWTDKTWNPIRGCSKVSAGCAHCYAEVMASRFGGPGLAYAGLTHRGHWNGIVRLVPDHLEDPLHWVRPQRIFVNSMSDLFHEYLDDEAILQVFDVIFRASQLRGHVFQILTKRADRMKNILSRLRVDLDHGGRVYLARGNTDHGTPLALLLPGLWVGISVEDQAAANARIPLLLETPAAVRWLSMEPLLGPVDLTQFGAFPEWVVVAGESGQHARPMDPAWARDLRDQCQQGKVPFFFKQWGEWMAVRDGTYRRIGKRNAGRLLDGVLHDAYPTNHLQ